MRNTSVRKHTRTPELEHDFVRDPNLGYEPEGSYGYVRCLEHGFPNPLVRWHYHEEYELHLILQTRGKVFVGDYIGHFEPGHLVLTGPRLPHNWISVDVGPEGVAKRDMVLQFSDEPLRRASELITDLRDVLPLLERARLGMTESSFSRYFRRATGNSFTDFVNRLRINRACQLLMETDRYITNVCYDVGFNNVANFNRRFLQLKGMTPKEFRRQAEARFGAGA